LPTGPGKGDRVRRSISAGYFTAAAPFLPWYLGVPFFGH
jgi:hypothetical protein